MRRASLKQFRYRARIRKNSVPGLRRYGLVDIQEIEETGILAPGHQIIWFLWIIRGIMMHNSFWRGKGDIENQRPSCPGNIFLFISTEKRAVFREITQVGILMFDPGKNIHMPASIMKGKAFFKECIIGISGTVLKNNLAGEIIVVHCNKKEDEDKKRSSNNAGEPWRYSGGLKDKVLNRKRQYHHEYRKNRVPVPQGNPVKKETDDKIERQGAADKKQKKKGFRFSPPSNKLDGGNRQCRTQED